jgi:hypothetical protein
MRLLSSRFARASLALVPAAALALGACSEGATGPDPKLAAPDAPAATVQSLQCKAYVRDGGVTCQGTGTPLGSARAVIIGGQRTYVWLRSSGVAFTAADSLFSFNVTIENLLNEALGTVDGVTLDSARVRVFFASGPVALGPGGGTVTVHNPTGFATFTSGSQPYFQYDEILAKNDTSAPKRWELKVAADSFAFTLLVAAEAQRRVVINEIMPNPAGTVQDSVGEYVEIYNAGTLRTNLKGFVLNDNTAGVTDTIKTDLFVAPGGYVLLGRSADASKNGGITPDYLYTSRIGTTSTSLTFSNSGSDFFRIRASTGVTVDSVFYTSGTTTAVAGVARELKNPALDNTLVDGSSWGAATAVYDPTTANNNRGTPKAQNSVFTP